MPCKMTFCIMCRTVCNAESPLKTGVLSVAGPGQKIFIPWLKYKKNEQKQTCWVVGRYCLICANVFKWLGRPLKHTACSILSATHCLHISLSLHRLSLACVLLTAGCWLLAMGYRALRLTHLLEAMSFVAWWEPFREGKITHSIFCHFVMRTIGVGTIQGGCKFHNVLRLH